MAQRYANGDRAWGICQRCGQRDRLNALVFDEQYPLLRVHVECFDIRHPQERLRPIADPVALWRPSPEDYPLSSPVIAVTQDIVARENNATWTAASSPVLNVNGYRLYRSLNDGAYELVGDYPVIRDDYGDIVTEPLSGDDAEDYGTGDIVAYFVVAYSGRASDGQDVYESRSNIVSVTYVGTPEGMNIPLVYNESDFAGLVTLTRSGYKSITPDGFVCNGYDNRLATTSIPANLQSATAELGFQVSMWHFGGEVRATSREVVACLGLDDASSTPKAEIYVDADPTDVNDPRVGFATRIGGVRTEFRLNRSRWQFQWRRHDTTIGGEQCYVQGLEYDPDTGNMIYAVSANDTASRVYEVDITTGEALRSFDFTTATHFNSIARRGNGEWWFCDSLNETFLLIDLEASFVAGTPVILRTVTHDLFQEGPCHCFATVSGTEYLLTGQYATSGTVYLTSHLASLLDSGTSITDVNRVNRWTTGFRHQGIAVGPDGFLYLSFGQGSYTGGRIVRISPESLIALGEGLSATGLENTTRNIVPPTNYPEDITFDADGWIWCGTESDISFEDDLNFNCLWRAKLYERSTDTEQVYFPGFPLNTYTCNYDGAGNWQILMNGRLFREFAATPDVTPGMIAIGGPIQAAAGGLNGFFRGVISGVHAGPNQIEVDQIPIFAKGAYDDRALTVYTFPTFNNDFETDTSGWTNEIGAIGRRTTNPPPYNTSDAGFGFGGTTVQCISRQRFATSSLLDGNGVAMSDADLDAGSIWFVDSFLTASFTNHGDSCTVGFRFLSNALAELSIDYGEIYSPIPDLIWKYRANNARTPPVGTRNVDIVYRSDRTDGTNNDGYVDKIRPYAFKE